MKNHLNKFWNFKQIAKKLKNDLNSKYIKKEELYEFDILFFKVSLILL